MACKGGKKSKGGIGDEYQKNILISVIERMNY